MSRITPLKQLWLHPLGHGFTLALVSLLAGCDLQTLLGGEPAIALTTFTAPPPSAQPYGVEGTLTEQELNVLFHLQFPQSYDAVSSRLGFPAKRDAAADYYQIEGTTHWIAVWYNGAIATGYGISE
jgi:hypothetical protein